MESSCDSLRCVFFFQGGISNTATNFQRQIVDRVGLEDRMDVDDVEIGVAEQGPCEFLILSYQSQYVLQCVCSFFFSTAHQSLMNTREPMRSVMASTNHRMS